MKQATRCKFEKDGKQCQAWAMTDSEFCFTHDPNKRKERALAHAKGGMTPKRNYKPLPPVELIDNKGVVNLLAQTINEVRRGKIDLRVANCIGYLSGHLIKALEISELEDRVEKIERVILEKKTTYK
mgnify:CR=1 FL=1